MLAGLWQEWPLLRWNSSGEISGLEELSSLEEISPLDEA
jgi:hypothetical protein